MTTDNIYSSLRNSDTGQDQRTGSSIMAKESAVAKASIIVVDDEEDILELIRYNLSREGYRITCVDSGEKALETVQHTIPDLLLLDLMLPGLDGIEVCKRLKAVPETSHIPIIMITAKTEESDLVIGLECGADDYITKPFSPRVLSARVKAILRNHMAASASQDPYLRFGDLAIHPGNHEVMVAGNPVDLTVTEFRILLTLARRPGWVFPRERIVDSARGTNTVVTSRSVDVHMVRLRNKLGPAGELIETVRGIGYRFRAVD